MSEPIVGEPMTWFRVDNGDLALFSCPRCYCVIHEEHIADHAVHHQSDGGLHPRFNLGKTGGPEGIGRPE